MPVHQTTIINRLGLHARAAARFVTVARDWPCVVSIGRTPEEWVNGKNIMAVMMLAASQGTPVWLHTEGDQAEQALAALLALIENRFDEED